MWKISQITSTASYTVLSFSNSVNHVDRVHRAIPRGLHYTRTLGVFEVVGPTLGVADGEGQRLTLFGSHSEQGIKSYWQKKILASTRLVTH